MPTPPLETLSSEQLVTVAGGFDIGQIASSIGGLVDKFGGTNGQATQVANQIGPQLNGLVSSFMGGAGAGAAGGAGGAPTGA